MKINFKLKIRKTFIRLILFFTFLVIHIGVSYANNNISKIYFVGPSVAIAPESDFVVNVLLDATKPINALDLEIIYPKDKLEFLNSDNTDSIVNIWQTPPTLFSNGNIVLVGAILKSFLGENGLIIKLSFRALSTGDVPLSFAKSNIYIADGKGTKLEVFSPSFSFSVAENGEIISSPVVPFKSTPSDILIEEGLKTFQSDMLYKKILTWLFLVFILVFIVLWVYNNGKQKL